jgi:hypothetical protein
MGVMSFDPLRPFRFLVIIMIISRWAVALQMREKAEAGSFTWCC